MGILGAIMIIGGTLIQGIGILLNVNNQTERTLEPKVKELEEVIDDLKQ